jgi:hypothetical protein
VQVEEEKPVIAKPQEKKLTTDEILKTIYKIDEKKNQQTAQSSQNVINAASKTQGVQAEITNKVNVQNNQKPLLQTKPKLPTNVQQPKPIVPPKVAVNNKANQSLIAPKGISEKITPNKSLARPNIPQKPLPPKK